MSKGVKYLKLLYDIQIMSRLYFDRTNVNDTYYTKERNTNDFILDELLQHLNFINDKYIVLENSQ